MKKLNYLEIFKNAFLLTWKNKFLWLFGFFIFLGSIASNLDTVFRNFGNSTQDPQIMAEFAQKNPNLFFTIGLTLFVLGAIVFLLKIISITAVVKSANNIKLYSQLPFVRIFTESKKYLWHLLLLGILISLSIFVVAIVLIIPILYLFTIKAEIFAIMMAVLGFVIFFPLLILAVYLNKYAYLFLILGDFKIKDSLELAYISFAKNIKKSLIMGAISLALNLAIIIALTFIGIIILAIFVALGLLTKLVFANVPMIAVAGFGAFVCIIILITLFSWYFVFMQTSWLFFFQEITFEKEQEKKKKVEETIDTKIPVTDPEVV